MAIRKQRKYSHLLNNILHINTYCHLLFMGLAEFHRKKTIYAGMKSTNFNFVVSCSMRSTVEKHCHWLQTTIKKQCHSKSKLAKWLKQCALQWNPHGTYLVDLTEVDAITHKSDPRQNGDGTKWETYQLKSEKWSHAKIMNALRKQSSWIWGQSFILVPDKEKCMRKWTAAKKIKIFYFRPCWNSCFAGGQHIHVSNWSTLLFIVS